MATKVRARRRSERERATSAPRPIATVMIPSKATDATTRQERISSGPEGRRALK